jgi:hypothetical protein
VSCVDSRPTQISPRPSPPLPPPPSTEPGRTRRKKGLGPQRHRWTGPEALGARRLCGCSSLGPRRTRHPAAPPKPQSAPEPEPSQCVMRRSRRVLSLPLYPHQVAKLPPSPPPRPIGGCCLALSAWMMLVFWAMRGAFASHTSLTAPLVSIVKGMVHARCCGLRTVAENSESTFISVCKGQVL